MPHIKNALIRFRIIDRCLRNKYKPFPTKQDLRIECEEALFGSTIGENICDSTIEKDMFAMKMEFDAPIRYSKRHAGYYYEDPDFSINDIPLTEDDLSSIRFAAKTLMQFREVDIFKQFGNAIDKIFDRVAIATDPTEDDLNHLVQFETAVSSGGNEFLPTLFEAIKASRFVSFEYTSFISGKSKLRKVLPLMLKEYRNRWYLITYDDSKKDIITFALDRMSPPKIEDEAGIKPEDFDPFSYFRYAIGITSNKSEPVNVVFKADNVAAKYIDSQPLHPNQQILREGKNRTTFQMTVLISEELIRSLLSYGGEIEVLEPETLRSIITERVKKMAENYSV
jgi:predicted DNA-binding transcriptional regulator YafY